MKIERIIWQENGWGEGLGWKQSRNPLEEIDLLVNKLNEIIDVINKE